MLAEILPKILAVCRDSALLTGLQPVLEATGARIEVADCAKTALTAWWRPLCLCSHCSTGRCRKQKSAS
jgi:hypothetical protein